MAVRRLERFRFNASPSVMEAWRSVDDLMSSSVDDDRWLAALIVEAERAAIPGRVAARRVHGDYFELPKSKWLWSTFYSEMYGYVFEHLNADLAGGVRRLSVLRRVTNRVLVEVRRSAEAAWRGEVRLYDTYGAPHTTPYLFAEEHDESLIVPAWLQEGEGDGRDSLFRQAVESLRETNPDDWVDIVLGPQEQFEGYARRALRAVGAEGFSGGNMAGSRKSNVTERKPGEGPYRGYLIAYYGLGRWGVEKDGAKMGALQTSADACKRYIDSIFGDDGLGADLSPKGAVETVPAGEYSSKGGYKIDGSVVQWWATRTQAVAGAKAIGWPVKSVVPVYTRFQMGYALSQTFGGLVTKAGYAAVLRGGAPFKVDGLSGKGATFQLTGEIVHVLRRADPRGWLALDDLALQAAYERVKDRVVLRPGATDVESWTAEIYNAFSSVLLRHGGRKDRSLDERGVRLHEAFQLAQSCKKAALTRSGRGDVVIDAGMDRYVAPTMEALGFDVHDARAGGVVETLTDDAVRPELYERYGDPLFHYVNTGETYSPTVGWDEKKGEWWFGSWGDWLKAFEAEHPPESEDPYADEPGEEDWITEDYQRFYSNGRLVIDVGEEGGEPEMWRKLNAEMARQQYFPTVWYRDDHGGMTVLQPSVADGPEEGNDGEPEEL